MSVSNKSCRPQINMIHFCMIRFVSSDNRIRHLKNINTHDIKDNFICCGKWAPNVKIFRWTLIILIVFLCCNFPQIGQSCSSYFFSDNFILELFEEILNYWRTIIEFQLLCLPKKNILLMLLLQYVAVIVRANGSS